MKSPQQILNAARRFFARETVLCIATASAIVSSCFVPPSIEYLSYIDWKVIGCLFCLMSVVAGLRDSGAFDILASSLLRLAGNARSLAAILVAVTFFASMGITNDVALITFVPLALILMREGFSWRMRAHIITLQTIAANIGSSLTPVGNPQNLFLFSFYRLSSRSFFVGIGPIVLAGGILLVASLFRIKQKALYPAHTGHNYRLKKKRFAVFIALFLMSVLAVFRVLDYRIVTVLVAIALVTIERDLISTIDYSLLFTFLAFFVFIGNLQEIDTVRNYIKSFVGLNVVLVSALTSQVISNVPAAILLSRFSDDPIALLRGVSIGGMGTLIASLASVISYKFFCHEYPSEGLKYLGVFTKWNICFFVFLFAVNLIL